MQVTETFLLELFFLQKKLIMSCQIILHIRLQAASDVAGVIFWPSFFHFVQEFLVYDDGIWAIDVAWFYWRIRNIAPVPLILFYLFETISERRLGNQDALDKILHFVRQIACKLIVCRQDFLI